MSRIGKNPVTIPAGVTVKVENNEIVVEGKLGKLVQPFSDVSIEVDAEEVVVSRPSDAKDHRAKHGLYRSLISNMVEGVSTGWTKELELVGVGYRASNQGQKLDLSLGFSHNIVLNIASEVKVETISEKGKNPRVKLTSFDKQLVGQVAAKIRGFRPPEPYKGKGVKFVGEIIRRKAGKSA
ncbi:MULTISPECIES: 50S ribosomal protein L6 [Nonlabens]|uniref:Large ribosomal subunit protein uL6 n=1 Tax=Nonlabens xylanidelens TaxID=191564 RepID=A0A2S6IJG2_9FLAO|nr:50S ribosomal protein L6 [Nonlabens xylanidelens]PPK94321.1 large subunit ribosomal protein L6 [Nonlabens xylanidelens]PQJ18855.1 50S ribosomal protein L6 [Nonlabens xylanidelens]